MFDRMNRFRVGRIPALSVTLLSASLDAAFYEIENQSSRRILLCLFTLFCSHLRRMPAEYLPHDGRWISLGYCCTTFADKHHGRADFERTDARAVFATVCSGFGILALVLSIVGLYGVVAYNTAKRRGEIGIRLVLGAGVSRVVRMIVREGMMLVGLGVLLGIPLIWLGAKYVQKELFRMKPIEPMSVLLSLGTLLAAALAAVLIPAVRAAMLQPAETLRRD
jgi:hypothetical protein